MESNNLALNPKSCVSGSEGDSVRVTILEVSPFEDKER